MCGGGGGKKHAISLFASVSHDPRPLHCYRLLSAMLCNLIVLGSSFFGSLAIFGPSILSGGHTVLGAGGTSQ
jgi:hypothetical protein